MDHQPGSRSSYFEPISEQMNRRRLQQLRQLTSRGREGEMYFGDIESARSGSIMGSKGGLGRASTDSSTARKVPVADLSPEGGLGGGAPGKSMSGGAQRGVMEGSFLPGKEHSLAAAGTPGKLGQGSDHPRGRCVPGHNQSHVLISFQGAVAGTSRNQATGLLP